MMKATEQLHNLGQSLWLDNITRGLLTQGTLRSYIDQLSLTGLTSNPTIFDHAIRNTKLYDEAIRKKAGEPAEALFFDLALDDLTRAADLFLPRYNANDSLDGFVSLELSPLLAYDADLSTKQAAQLYSRAKRKNLLIKIPGTHEGL